MKQSKVTVLSGVFTLCVCLAPVMPLHACEQSGDRDNKAATSVSDTVEKQTGTPKSEKVGAEHQQAAVHKTTKIIKVAKHSVDASVESEKIENKMAAQKEPSEPELAHVDYKELEERLKNTDAIGFFTKLAIRNDIIDLVDKIKQYRKKSMLKAKMKEIRARFDGLLLKIIALLEEDPDLSRDLYVGRESIWESLLEVKA